MLTFYLIGLVAFAVLTGYNTRSRAWRADAHSLLSIILWPIPLIMAVGHAARMFSARRASEDAIDGMDWPA